MNQAVKIKLIAKTYTTNSIGVVTATEVEKTRWAIKSNINQSEFYEAGQQGLKPYACYSIRVTEYDGEDEIKVGNKRLTVYRTYNRTDGRVELYTTERKGQK